MFSTGLDQRIRCWLVGEHGKLTEHAHLIISVPEPEALDARACGRSVEHLCANVHSWQSFITFMEILSRFLYWVFVRNHYQIAVAGRGMQMVEFFAALQ